jgi:antirestriction protein ArdC
MPGEGTQSQLTERTKNMKVEEVKQITNNALDELAASLESGRSETLTAYLKTMALFSKYSLNNLFLIARQRPDARRVAGYQTWHKLGRHVRKGEKGIAIIAPMIRRKSEVECLDSADEQSVVRGFKVAHVFSEEQTEGEPLPEIGQVTGDPGYYLSRLEQFVRENGIELRYSDEIAPARGMAEKGKITLLPGQTPAETFATLVHEVAHSELHFGERRSHTTKRIRETEAESVAYVVCSAVGLETGTAAQDYVGLYGGDSKVLLESLQYIQQAANRILAAIAPENSATHA